VPASLHFPYLEEGSTKKIDFASWSTTTRREVFFEECGSEIPRESIA